MSEKIFDIAIIGGGLAGLTMSIQLVRAGHTVILMEKEAYPFHKVCGEYISMESHTFLEGLGLPLSGMRLPVINRLVVSSPGGKVLRAPLDMGGFGISRYKIDHDLKNIAAAAGVQVMEKCKAEDILYTNGLFEIRTTKGVFQSRVCCGSYGKRSNIDVSRKRGFTLSRPNKLNNYIAVKYHIETSSEANTIALHNFRDGYCGISEIEDGKHCLCYLTNAANLKLAGSIELMEEHILSKNPHLEKIFSSSKKSYSQPLTISQISFEKRSQVEDHMILTGDAAGMITPLCGNGMSMAIHAGKIAVYHIDRFLKNEISRDEMETLYIRDWNKEFGKRLKAGRIIQSLFGKEVLTEMFVRIVSKFPFAVRKLISLTHGDRF